jgi:malonyl CoA-acyl carrier protein transacylase
VRPQALLGYSLGEYTAACLAGVLSLEDAVTLVARRAQLIAGLPAGAMMAVPLPEDELLRRLQTSPAGLSIAAVTAPSVCVVSGPVPEVEALERELAGEGHAVRRLPTTHAFHSAMMEPIEGAFRELLRTVELRAPQLPYLSNVTGTWAQPAQVADPEHWVRHLRGTVRFADAVGELWREPGRILVELGPGPSLGSLALQHPAAPGAGVGGGGGGGGGALASLRHEHDRQDDQAFLLRTLGQLWLLGVDSDAAGITGFFRGERRRRVPLPTYPFERQRYWLDRPTAAPQTPQTTEAAQRRAAPPGNNADRAAWFHAPSWKLAPRRRPTELAADGGGLWLLFLDDLGVGERLAEALAGSLSTAGVEVATVVPGEGFADLGAGMRDRRFRIDPREARDYESLLAGLPETPRRIVHLWTLGDLSADAAQDRGFYSLLHLAQALGKRGLTTVPETGPVRIEVVTDGLGGVERGDPLRPEKATLIGPVRVISQEYPGLSCRAVDVDPAEPTDGLLSELLGGSRDPLQEAITALRGDRRWLPAAAPLPLEPADPVAAQLRQGGVYLITGGLGGLGLGLAEHLARTVGARLALLGRTGLPEGEEREKVLAADPEGRAARRIRAVEAFEAAGAEVMVIAADVADEAAVREAVGKVLQRFGRLDGVFHTAGLPGAGLAQLKERATAAEVLAPKVQGTLALAAALRDVPVDFLVLYSAITSLSGGVGQVDYCAANAFLDAFAQASRAPGRDGGVPVVAVNWCEWQWDDWAGQILAQDPRFLAELQRQRQLFGLTFEEGFDALTRALASGLPQVIVSTRPLQAVLEQQHSVAELLETLQQSRPAHAAGIAGIGHDRPSLGTDYVAPEGEVAERLAAIWGTLLGVRQVGAHDNFFQLGGHSLLGLQLLSRIQAAFGVELPLRVLFEAPTVAELAAAVAAAQAGGAGGGDGAPSLALVPEIRRADSFDAREVLENLDALSEEEMDRLLGEMMAEEGEA